MATFITRFGCDCNDLVMHYLGFKYCCLSFCKVNKKWYKMCQEVFTTKLRKPKLGETDARNLLGILDLMRFTVYQHKVVELSPKAASMLKKVTDIFKLRQGPETFDDLEKLNFGMYLNWNSHNGNPGVISWTRDWLSADSSIKTKWEALLERDAKYWNDSRVNSTFHVLFVRTDGTILVSVDFQKVYLVLGIVHAIDDIHNGRMVQNATTSIPDFFGYIGCKCLQCRSPLISVHGTFMGKRASTTLLNWDDKVVYDGLFKVDRAMTDNETRRAVAAYISAVDDGSLITRLEKRIIQAGGNSMPSSSTSFRCAAGKAVSQPGGEDEPLPPRPSLPPPPQPSPIRQSRPVVPDQQSPFAAIHTRKGSFVSSSDMNAIKSQLQRAFSLAETDTVQISMGPIVGGLMTGEDEKVFMDAVSRMTSAGAMARCAVCGECDRVEDGEQVIMARCALCAQEYFCCHKHHRELWMNHTKTCGMAKTKK